MKETVLPCGWMPLQQSGIMTAFSFSIQNLDFFYGNPGFHKVITHSVTGIGNPALNRENGMSFEINIRNDTVLGNR